MSKLPSTGTIVRTGILVLTMANAGLELAGMSPLPIDNEQVAEVVSYGMVVAASLTTWWKNNSFTQKAIEADELLKSSK